MARTLSQMYLLLTSISGVFVGMNCVLFLFCVYVLWGQKSNYRRLLLFSSVVQFCLCLAQIALFITDISLGFTVHASASEAYFLRLNSDYVLPSYIIYIINNAIEGSLLVRTIPSFLLLYSPQAMFIKIWRIYIIHNKNIKFCIPTIILLILEDIRVNYIPGFAGATARGAATVHVNSARQHAFSLVTWALIASVNASATLLIFVRLWIARQKAIATFNQSKYKSTIIVVVECGLLVTVCTVAMLVLHVVQHPVGIAGVGITTQIATMAPLLILARYGILSRRDEPRGSHTSQIPLRISVVRTHDTRVDTPVQFSRKNRLSPDPWPVYPGANHPKPFCDA
ncbi:hypothetical protein V8E55_005925 [Tylopilus felleus]